MKLRLTLFLLLLLTFSSFGQNPFTICSWNLKDLGKSKSDSEIEFIANTIQKFDVVAIQEVVAGFGGSQAVARLQSALNRKGGEWDYAISEPTSGTAYKTERYAFIWKSSRLKKVGDAWLEKKYHLEIDREPFYITLEAGGKDFTVVNFHAITKSMQPEREIKYFKFLPAAYNKLNLIFAGDFNIPQSHTVFTPLRKMGYTPGLIGQKTSLKQTCPDNDCLSSEFDNFYFAKARFKSHDSGIIPFYKAFADHGEARLISDHVPIFLRFSLN
ncbi:endonuclease/exonuclease/phosphatase family protein [Flavihumibacter sp. R14]|nr:endonuclease/exonuclease/phosphatase family protein [Flavihumibacter soli]